MLIRRRLLSVIPILALLACSQPSAQSGQEAEALKKEIEALKAQQAEMQKSLDEVRDFLREVTKGAFGRPSLVNTAFEVSGAPANGQPSAPLTLVEISDYHCPFCRRHFDNTQPQLYSEYVSTGKLRHVFIHYPIDQLHPDAYRSHEAASCAADQGKFWELHAKLFQRPSRTIDEITAVAQGIGLDMTAFRSCLEGGKHRETVRASVERIQQLGISGTPMFLIGRTPPAGSQEVTVLKKLEGAQPYAVFKKEIDALLK
jgi:protein-disulfide isomerase